MRGRVIHHIVLTVALTFATIEAPRALNRSIRENFDVPDIHPVIEPELVDEFMRSNHVRLIGYSCLAVVILLIVVGFTTEKKGLSSAGAIVFFLPTFGYFAGYMFFLAGLGLLRALWLPFLGQPVEIRRYHPAAVHDSGVPLCHHWGGC